MTKVLMTPDIVRRQYAMNPASVVYEPWPDDTNVFAQKVRAQRRPDEPVEILNKDWKATWAST